MEIIKKMWGNKNRNYYVALLFFTIFWLAFLGFSGTLTSGYHLTDDHEIVNINNYLSSGGGIISVSEGVIKNDLNIRFRPFYYFYRVLETKMFGTDFFAWSIHNLILVILTSFFFCCSFRMLKFSFWASFFAVLLIFLGSQASIWWRLGPNETIGVFLFSITFIFLILDAKKKNNLNLYHFCYLLFAVAMSLCKESFVILLPAIFFLKVYSNKYFTEITWKKAIKRNIADGIILLSVTLVELFIIIFYVGTNKIGYAGVDRLYYLGYLYTAWDLFMANGVGVVIIVALLSILWINHKNNIKASWKQQGVELVREFLPVLILTVLIVAPQVVLYTKSSINSRYIIPGIVGFVVLLLYLLKKINETTKQFAFLKASLYLLMIFFVYKSLNVSFEGAKYFTKEGVETKELLKTLDPKNYPSGKYLIVADPDLYPEWSASIGIYAIGKMKNENVFIYPLVRKESPTVSDSERLSVENFGLGIYGDKRFSNLKERADFSAIVIFPRMEKTFLAKYPQAVELQGGDFARREIGNFVVYEKN